MYRMQFFFLALSALRRFERFLSLFLILQAISASLFDRFPYSVVASGASRINELGRISMDFFFESSLSSFSAGKCISSTIYLLARACDLSPTSEIKKTR
ncbi:hypothetical protein B0H12DRAFT_1122397 [Mycena haematopus]|nr:hypothetical protein B0H12DRAFT_1122397 [Mycena haematopus]